MSALCLAFLTITALLSEINGLPITRSTRNSSTTAVNRNTRSYDDELGVTEISNQCCSYSDSWCIGITNYTTIEKKAKKCIEDKRVTLKSGEKCPTPSKILKKKEGRSLYCSLLNIVDEQIVTNVIPVLVATNSCVGSAVGHLPNKEIREPAQFVKAVKKWLDNMRMTHMTDNCCFEPYNITKEEEEELISKSMYSIDEKNKSAEELAIAIAIQRKNCNERWGGALYLLSIYVNAVEMLESLGRRKSCLRGCVGEASVKCVEHYLFKKKN